MKKGILILLVGFLLSGNAYADNLEITDGDTIKLNGERIRFSGIDTPESYYRGKGLFGNLYIKLNF